MLEMYSGEGHEVKTKYKRKRKHKGRDYDS
jgi:hypothetical protein